MTELSYQMIDRIQNMALRTWDVIGGDILTVTEEMGDDPILTCEEVVEAVCDADYMRYHGRDKEAYDVWNDLPFKQQIKIVGDAFKSEVYGW